MREKEWLKREPNTNNEWITAMNILSRNKIGLVNSSHYVITSPTHIRKFLKDFPSKSIYYCRIGSTLLMQNKFFITNHLQKEMEKRGVKIDNIKVFNGGSELKKFMKNMKEEDYTLYLI